MSERSQVMGTSQPIESLEGVETPIVQHYTDRKIIDRILALLALCIFSPVLIVIAITLLMSCGWPIFFRQERVGKGGKSFYLLKFRTMRTGKNGPSITARGDARITPVGKVLRKFKLDL